jgi:hypothetical protein
MLFDVLTSVARKGNIPTAGDALKSFQNYPLVPASIQPREQTSNNVWRSRETAVQALRVCVNEPPRGFVQAPELSLNIPINFQHGRVRPSPVLGTEKW